MSGVKYPNNLFRLTRKINPVFYENITLGTCSTIVLEKLCNSMLAGQQLLKGLATTVNTACSFKILLWYPRLPPCPTPIAVTIGRPQLRKGFCEAQIRVIEHEAGSPIRAWQTLVVQPAPWGKTHVSQSNFPPYKPHRHLQ